MSPSFLVLLSFLIGGGSGELLDYVPTQSYWRDRNVAVTVEAMLQEAAPTPSVDASKLITDLGNADSHIRDSASEHILKYGIGVLPPLRLAAGSADPETAEGSARLIEQMQPLITIAPVRHLMAVRTLGELKDKKAIAFLQSQLSSQEMFVADYARRAIDSIYGQPADHVIPEDALNEVWLLPANCRAVAQLLPRGHGPIDPRQMMMQIPGQGMQDTGHVFENLSQTALHVAETLGNMRLDALNLGVSENIDGNHGCITLIASGQFDAALVSRILREQKMATRTVRGLRIYEPDGESTMLFPSDHEFVMMFSPNGEQAPSDESIAAMMSGTQTLRRSPEMTALVMPMLHPGPTTRHALWMAAKMTDSYRKLTGFDRFDTLTLTGDEDNGALNVALRGVSPDADAAKAAMEQLAVMIAGAAKLVKLNLAGQPLLQPTADFVASTKFLSQGNIIAGSALLKESPAELFMLPVMVGANVRTN